MSAMPYNYYTIFYINFKKKTMNYLQIRAGLVTGVSEGRGQEWRAVVQEML